MGPKIKPSYSKKLWNYSLILAKQTLKANGSKALLQTIKRVPKTRWIKDYIKLVGSQNEAFVQEAKVCYFLEIYEVLGIVN